MTGYKDAIDASKQYHFDELPEPTQEALYAAAAAEKLNEILAWMWGHGHSSLHQKRKARLARLEVIAVIMGRQTQEQAAEQAGVSVRVIERHKADFCKEFGVEKKYSEPVREKR